MEEARIICTPFIIAAIISCLAMLYYERQWKKQNPWWQQDDRKMRLSPAELAYRQNERRKQHNALMCWFATLFMIIGMMIMTLSARAYGGLSNLNHYWLYLVPIVGIIFFALICIQRRK